jgi:hypothetical protein
VQLARDTMAKAGGFEQAKEFTDWLAEHGTPSTSDLQAEAAGRAAPGHRKWTMMESIDVAMTDALEGMPQ